MLIYVPKRIHFGDDTYNMRVELAVLDWVRMLTCDYSEPKENILVRDSSLILRRGGLEGN